MSMLVMVFVFSIAALGILAWVVTEIFGKSNQPHASTGEDAERVRQLTRENAQLNEQLGAVHDRLETLERIVTDKPSRLEAEIDALKTLTDKREIQE